MTTSTVVVIGDALMDDIESPQGVETFVGGAALNVAVGLAMLGVDVSLVAMVGDDEGGRLIRSFLDHHQVQLTASPSPLGTGRALSRRVDGEPTYSFNDASRNRRIEFDGQMMKTIDSARLVVVSCFPFDDPEQAKALRTSVRDPEHRLIIDVNPRAGMMHDLATFVREFETTAALSSLVKIGADDARLLYDSELDLAASRLHDTTHATIFATDGSRGASITRRDGTIISRPIAPFDGDIVDPMGAGDSTLASMASSILTMDDTATDVGWAQALERSMLLAAATCRIKGATPTAGW